MLFHKKTVFYRWQKRMFSLHAENSGWQTVLLLVNSCQQVCYCIVHNCNWHAVHSVVTSALNCYTDFPIYSLNKFDRRRITMWSAGQLSYQRRPSITRRAELRNLPARGRLGLIISICSQAFFKLICAPSDDVTRGVPEVILVTSSCVTSEVMPQYFALSTETECSVT